MRNVSDRRVSLDGVQIGDAAVARFFEIPDGLALDEGERLAIAFGDASMQAALLDSLDLEGLAGDTTIQWVWQDRYELPDSGARITLLDWNESEDDVLVLDEVAYVADSTVDSLGEGLIRRLYTAWDASYEEADLEKGQISLTAEPSQKLSPGTGFNPFLVWRKQGREKLYELKDHLGNVTVVVTDRRTPVEDQVQTGEVAYFEAEVEAARDYYPFGMLMVGRTFTSGDYRYGFNGKEMDDEFGGEGNMYDYGFRVHDPRLGRFLSVDPLEWKYSYDSPYCSFGNDPIINIDPNGEEKTIYLYILAEVRDQRGKLLYKMSDEMVEQVKNKITDMVNKYSEGNVQVVHVTSGAFVSSKDMDRTDTRLFVGGYHTLEAIKQLKDGNGFGHWYQGKHWDGTNRELQGGLTPLEGAGEPAYFFEKSGAEAFNNYADKVAYGAVHELIHKYTTILNRILYPKYKQEGDQYRSERGGDHEEEGWMKNGGPRGNGSTPGGNWEGWDETIWFRIPAARVEFLKNIGYGPPPKDNVKPNENPEEHGKIEFHFE